MPEPGDRRREKDKKIITRKSLYTLTLTLEQQWHMWQSSSYLDEESPRGLLKESFSQQKSQTEQQRGRGIYREGCTLLMDLL